MITEPETQKMITTATEKQNQEAVSLPELATTINGYYRRSNQAAVEAMEYAYKVGSALVDAKKQVAHGQWGSWIDANLDVKERQARKYMRLWNNRESIEAKRHSNAVFNICLLYTSDAADE